jgi:phosphoribosylformylglycinamidine cyclo-ligase
MQLDEAITAQILPMMELTDRHGKSDVAHSVHGLGGICSFAPSSYQDPLLVSSTNGVGTKLRIAALMERSETIGIDLVALCVNDIAACGAEPLFFMDHLATSKLDAKQALQVARGVTEACKDSVPFDGCENCRNARHIQCE